MSDSWNIEVLRQHIDSLPGDNGALHSVLDSIDRYAWIFRYHLRTARDSMKGVTHSDDPHGIKNIRYVFGDAERQEEYVQAKLISEAHILGCIHCARAMFDVFSHLANGLLLGNALTVRDCTIKTVTKRLQSCALKQELQSLLDSQWFKYVDGFLNTAKHRGLVQHAFQVSFVGAQAGIRLSGFEHAGTTFPAYSVEELLVGVLEVKNKLVHCGRTFSEHVIEGKI